MVLVGNGNLSQIHGTFNVSFQYGIQVDIYKHTYKLFIVKLALSVLPETRRRSNSRTS